MNQTDLIKKVAEISGQTQTTVEHVLKTAADVVVDGLGTDGEVALPGLGKFVATEKAARTGRNPKTGEPVEIPAHKSVKFRAFKALKHGV